MKLEPVVGARGRPVRWPGFRVKAEKLRVGEAIELDEEIPRSSAQSIALSLTYKAKGNKFFRNRIVNGKVCIERLK